MHLYYLALSLIMILFSTSTTLARDLMDPVVVTATKVKLKDTKAPYASEIYYRKEIEKSGARTVIDFLNQNTSVVIMSNSGSIGTNQKLTCVVLGLQKAIKIL